MGGRAGNRTLTALKVAALAKTTKRKYYADGGSRGLYLAVTPGGASWAFRFREAGKLREMGLGPLDTVTLAAARDKALEARKLRLDGIDPIARRKEARQASALAAAKTMTFCQCAEAYMKSHSLTWKNPKHAAQWASTLTTYAYPVFGDLPVAAIDTALVMRVVEPLWSTKPETASRLRGRIEAVLSWATVSGFRKGDNPAQWRGHLSELLPAASKAKAAVRATTGREEHHAALAYAEIGAFLTELREQEGIAARALEFAILTAARTGEVIGARWGEIDIAEKLWTVPADRMKARKEHRVPLSDAALAIIDEMAAIRSCAFVFPGASGERPLSNMALLMCMRRMGRGDLTTHGFRSSFRDWAAERTNFPSEVAEMALAHTVGDKVEAAYRRGDLFEKRRRVMDDWATFCAMPAPIAGKVVAIRA